MPEALRQSIIGGRLGRPTTEREVRKLIRRMASENLTWGAPRIHAELQKLGLSVSERTVSHYMPKRPAEPEVIERWKAFLHWRWSPKISSGGGAVHYLGRVQRADQRLSDYFVVEGASPRGVLMAKRFLLS